MRKLTHFILGIVGFFAGIVSFILMLIWGFIPLITEVLIYAKAVDVPDNIRIGLYELWGVLMLILGMVINEPKSSKP